jgi:uncharacterized protein (TIRG00374 family)
MALVSKAARIRWKPLLGGAAALAVVVGVFVFVLPRVIDYADVWDAIRDIPPVWIGVLAVAAVLNVITFAPTLMAALPGLRLRAALAVTLASTASTYIAPGGAAVGAAFTFAMLRAWGFRGQQATIGVAVSSVFNLMFTFGAPAIALTLLTIEGGTNPLLRTAAVAGLIVFTIVLFSFALGLWNERQAEMLGDAAARATSWLLARIGRDPVGWSGATFAEFRADAVSVLKRRWPALTAGTLSGHLTVYLLLLLSLRAVGVGSDDVTIVESFAAWSLVRLIAALPLTPGGFGIVELGLSGTLIAFGGDQGEVLAAVLVYRFLTVVPPLVLGTLAAVTWRRHHPGWQHEDEATAA